MGEHSLDLAGIEDMNDVTLERNPMDANSVEKPTEILVPYKCTKESILERSLLNVRNVKKPSLVTKPFNYI